MHMTTLITIIYRQVSQVGHGQIRIVLAFVFQPSHVSQIGAML